MAIADPYRELARAQLIEQIENGNALDWFNMSTYPELGNRTATEAWRAGDHEAVERLIDRLYADAESRVERRRADPKFMEMLNSRRQALIARRADLDAKRAEADKRRSA
jgi:hypothetical protein